uniref:GRIP domain-containing protein n=1 Tax=Kwoniella dejecticola CBS 10117 TaxID=1296121 RepID=A0A1A6A2V1_9TREE|nr:uncharacterized protein I303_05241 [Kwoniella dejecticola CBS 10117]OBR84383.1 hypothetical protein I303_05241 [Kwoniella dejecticola CBS 10117]
MFGSSLQDRLNAAVKTLEATGSSLQARALSVNANPNANTNANTNPAPSSPKDTPRRTGSPSVSKSPIAPSSPLSTSTENVSPTKSTGASAANAAGSYVGSTAHLAENALSGLRKSFHFGRQSQDLPRPSSTPQQELKNINTPTATPSSPSAGPSTPRSSSPNPKLLPTSTFTLGSDPSSRAATPIPKSPAGRRGSKLALASDASADTTIPLPPPDPSDPATYPLPPSPTLSAAETLTTPSTGFADPLGASPLLGPSADQEVPKLGLQVATPDTENKEDVVGLGMDVIGADNEKVEIQITRNGDAAKDDGPDGETGIGIGVEKPVIELSGEEIKKLADSERRYEDLSQRFTTLLTQSHKANQVLKELTPLEGGIADHEAMEGWIRMVTSKVDMITAEMKRLQDKLTLQDSRMEELRDTHRLEGTSQADLITKLRSELTEAQEKAETASTDNTTLTQVKADLSKAHTQAKEEEEKRTKAISLLKTVRLKLVKVEKEKEEIEKDRAEERAERARASEEVERIKGEKEREVTQLRKSFERESAAQKERFEKDLSTKKAAWELEMITTKASHAKTLSERTTKVNGLEAIVKELNVNKQKTFEEYQAKVAEAELARSEMESLSTRTKELEFQLRESNERCALLEDSMRESNNNRASPAGSRRNSFNKDSVDVKKLLAEAESKSESKLSDLRYKIKSLEDERNEIEEEWSLKLQERLRELEKLRRTIQEKDMDFNDSLRGLKERELRIENSEEKVKALEKELFRLKSKIEDGKGDIQTALDAERSAKDEVSSLNTQIHTLQSQLDDSKSHITQLKSTNKTLREEMRKLQSSVQLMERQRNPGVGYWSGTPVPVPARSSVSSPSPALPPGAMESPGTSTGTNTPTGTGQGDVKKQDEEEVNLEYLRNVILQFLEHKEMRPNLIRVMSVILRFTPQELRRLNAKLQT